MAENLKRRPKKSILKNSSSFDKQESQINAKKQKETKWDEMNIIATLHPADKDYGHMKIQEPKTPYNYTNPDEVDADINPQDLLERMQKAMDKPPKALIEPADDSDEDDLTEEEKEKKKEFEQRRKKHYNEFHALQLAKKLLEEEEEEDDDEAGQSSSSRIHK